MPASVFRSFSRYRQKKEENQILFLHSFAIQRKLKFLKMKRLLSLIVLAFGTLSLTLGQVYTNKVVGEKNEALKDSIIAKPYPYSLPIWGAKVAARGYDLPYSAGFGVNYLWQRSDLIIENLFVGFNNGPMYDLDEIIRFDKAIATASAINLRPDIWLLPFLNVYGIFTKANTSTEIGAGVWLPDTANMWKEVTSFSSKAEFEATGVGFGMTPTIGVGGGWLALDMNVTWQSISALDKPVFTFVFGPRLGKSFKFKKPERNIAFWAGGFRLHLKSETSGSLPLNEVLPIDDLQTKVDNGIQNVEDKQVAVDTWWEGLTPVEQKNPVNKAKYETANRTLETAGNILNSADAALNDEKSATVQYSLNKRPKDMWNFVLGSQFQINKHFMIRAEYGFLGSRQQFIGGLQYRFGL
jgi:hypothetical protein